MKAQSTYIDLAKVDQLIAKRKKDEALQLAEKFWQSQVEKASLDEDEKRLLVIIGSILHESGSEEKALGYLHRFKQECIFPLPEDAAVYEWGLALYWTVYYSLRIKLRHTYKSHKDRDVRVDQELAKLCAAQMPGGQAEAAESKRKKTASTASSKTKAQTTKAAQASSGGCLITMLAVLGGSGLAIALTVIIAVDHWLW